MPTSCSSQDRNTCSVQPLRTLLLQFLELMALAVVCLISAGVCGGLAHGMAPGKITQAEAQAALESAANAMGMPPPQDVQVEINHGEGLPTNENLMGYTPGVSPMPATITVHAANMQNLGQESFGWDENFDWSSPAGQAMLSAHFVHELFHHCAGHSPQGCELGAFSCPHLATDYAMVQILCIMANAVATSMGEMSPGNAKEEKRLELEALCKVIDMRRDHWNSEEGRAAALACLDPENPPDCPVPPAPNCPAQFHLPPVPENGDFGDDGPLGPRCEPCDYIATL